MIVELYSKNYNSTYLTEVQNALKQLSRSSNYNEFLDYLHETTGLLEGVKEVEIVLDSVGNISFISLLKLCTRQADVVKMRIGQLDYMEGAITSYALDYIVATKDIANKDALEYLTYQLLISAPNK